MKRKIVSLLMAATIAVGAAPAAFAALDGFSVQQTYAGQFADVPASAWYYDAVKSAYEMGLVSGTSDTAYSPSANVTVGQVQAFVARIHAAYHGNTIEPGGDVWYVPYVEYCKEHIDYEICSMAYMLDGDSVLANMPATRDYFAYLIYAALPLHEYPAINNVADGALKDVDESTFNGAYGRIYTLYRAGILAGSDAYGTFNPNSYITRAEVAAILVRMVDPAQRVAFTLQEKPVNTYRDVTDELTATAKSFIQNRIAQENMFGSQIGVSDTIFTRANWRQYEENLLGCLVDRTLYGGMYAIGTYLYDDPNTAVPVYMVSQADFDAWMNYYYGVDAGATTPNPGIYTDGICLVNGGQGYIGDDIYITRVYALGSNQYYVQFNKTYETDSDMISSPGYAVLHWDEDHYQVYELGWETAQIPPENLDVYLAN